MKRRAGEMGMWGVLWITLTSASGGAADLPYGLVAGLKPKRHHGFGPSRLVPRIGARSPDFIGIRNGRQSVRPPPFPNSFLLIVSVATVPPVKTFKSPHTQTEYGDGYDDVEDQAFPPPENLPSTPISHPLLYRYDLAKTLKWPSPVPMSNTRKITQKRGSANTLSQVQP